MTNVNQPVLFEEFAPEPPKEPVEVRIDGPLSSSTGDPYITQNERERRELERDLAIAEEAHREGERMRAERAAAKAREVGGTVLLGSDGKPDLELTEDWLRMRERPYTGPDTRVKQVLDPDL